MGQEVNRAEKVQKSKGLVIKGLAFSPEKRRLAEEDSNSPTEVTKVAQERGRMNGRSANFDFVAQLQEKGRMDFWVTRNFS